MSSIPTLVELEQDQYVAFTDLISGIAIDIEGENITLNADFTTLTDLQNSTYKTLSSFKTAFDTSDTHRTSQLNSLFSLIQNSIVDLKNINELSFALLSGELIDIEDINSKGFIMLNTTLTDLYSLERQEVSAITDELFRKIEKVNDVLNAINGVASTIDNVIGVVNTFISTTQNQNLAAQVAEQQTTNTLLEETNTLLQSFIDTLPVKILATIDETPFTLNAPEGTVDDTAYSYCEILDPIIGEGPINCQINAMLGLEIPTLSLVSVLDKKEDSN